MFDRFTDHARKVLGHSRQEAQRLHHDHIGTEHMLVGVVQVSNSTAARALRSEDVDLVRVRAKVEELVPRGVTPVTKGKMPFTPNGKKALELSLEAAVHCGDHFIGTVYLLIGLIREDGTAARVLEELGVDLIRFSEALGADSRPASSEQRHSLYDTSEVSLLKAEIDELRRRNDALEQRIERLESGS